MSKEDVLLFGCYGMRGTGKSYYEKLKEKDKEITRLNKKIKRLKQKIELLMFDIDQANSTLSNYAKRILNALNYMDSIVFQWTEFKEIKDKLLGVDKNV